MDNFFDLLKAGNHDKGYLTKFEVRLKEDITPSELETVLGLVVGINKEYEVEGTLVTFYSSLYPASIKNRLFDVWPLVTSLHDIVSQEQIDELDRKIIETNKKLQHLYDSGGLYAWGPSPRGGVF